jgi:NH3-dependent NAD+ synthetase
MGDQMSHYNVNGGVPKTLIQHLLLWVVSSEHFDDEVGAVLTDVLDTKITPELVPPGEDDLGRHAGGWQRRWWRGGHRAGSRGRRRSARR